MLKKVLKKLSRVTARKQTKSTKRPSPLPKKPSPSNRILTAEGWRRLMMKKHPK